MLDIANQSYAITLWTYWHIVQEREILRKMARFERLDLAGLIRDAVHDPNALKNEFNRYKAEISEQPVSATESKSERLAKVLSHVKAHQNLVPIDPPSDHQ